MLAKGQSEQVELMHMFCLSFYIIFQNDRVSLSPAPDQDGITLKTIALVLCPVEQVKSTRNTYVVLGIGREADL